METKRLLLMVNPSDEGSQLEQGFLRTGFSVVTAKGVEQGIEVLKKETIDALIVDWDLVGSRINQIQQTMREENQRTALVLISQKRDTDERIRALESGADDCLNKTSEVDELVAKVRALIRRAEMIQNTPKTLKIKDIEINLDTHEVQQNNQKLDLTYTQFKLLYLLASKRETVFSREDILERVWGESAYVTDRTVDVHVKRLREKLGEDKHPSKYIQTIHGLGYRFS